MAAGFLQSKSSEMGKIENVPYGSLTNFCTNVSSDIPFLCHSLLVQQTKPGTLWEHTRKWGSLGGHLGGWQPRADSILNPFALKQRTRLLSSQLRWCGILSLHLKKETFLLSFIQQDQKGKYFRWNLVIMHLSLPWTEYWMHRLCTDYQWTWSYWRAGSFVFLETKEKTRWSFQVLSKSYVKVFIWP